MYIIRIKNARKPKRFWLRVEDMTIKKNRLSGRGKEGLFILNLPKMGVMRIKTRGRKVVDDMTLEDLWYRVKKRLRMLLTM